MLDYSFHRLSSCFTAGDKTQDGKMEKAKAKARKSTESEGQKRTTENPTQEKTAESGRNGTKQVKKKTVLCRVESKLSLVPASLGYFIRPAAR